MKRRNFLSSLLPLLATLGFASQKATMQKGKAVVCATDAIRCPLGHESCRTVDAPLVVGNNDHEYPSWAQLYDYHIVCCDVCGIYFKP